MEQHTRHLQEIIAIMLKRNAENLDMTFPQKTDGNLLFLINSYFFAMAAAEEVDVEVRFRIQGSDSSDSTWTTLAPMRTPLPKLSRF